MSASMWKVVSPDLLIFFVVLLGYMLIRRKTIPSLNIVKGHVAYLPPQEEDLLVMEKTNQPVRENAKGEKNKFDKKRVPKKCKFPYRTIDINEQMVQYCQDFFPEYDFFFMMSTVSICQFVVTTIAKMLFPGHISGNLAFYMMLFSLFIAASYLLRGKMSCKCTDETKIEFLVGAKAIIAVFIVLYQYGSEPFLGFDLAKEHKACLEKTNSVLNLLGGRLDLPVEYTYFLLSLFAAFITFTTVQLNVTFAYYTFTITRPSMSTRMAETPDGNKAYKRLLYIMYGNIFLPVLVCISFLTALSEQLLVPSVLSQDMYGLVKIFTVMATLLLRMMSFREELQFGLNESYILINKFVQLKNQNLFRYIQLRIKENFLLTWFIIFKHLCSIVIPLVFLLCKLNRFLAFHLVPENQSWEYDLKPLQMSIEKAAQDQREFNLFDEQDSLQHVLGEMASKGIWNFEMQNAFMEFAIFWFYFSQVFVFTFAFLYYRKYLDK